MEKPSLLDIIAVASESNHVGGPTGYELLCNDPTSLEFDLSQAPCLQVCVQMLNFPPIFSNIRSCFIKSQTIGPSKSVLSTSGFGTIRSSRD